jgi:hypothetical protein
MTVNASVRSHRIDADLNTVPARPFHVYTQRDLDRLTAVHHLPADQRFAMKVVSTVLPFRVNDYVVEDLIDWASVPDDPIFQLTFPQPGMLGAEHFNTIADLLRLLPPGPRSTRPCSASAWT